MRRYAAAAAALLFATPAGAAAGGALAIGPRLSIVNVPTPSVGLELKAFDLVGASVDYGFIPDVTIDGVTGGMTSWSVGAKLYPTRGALFVGVAYGERSLNVHKADPLTGLSGRMDMSTTWIAPELGWRWVWQSGLFMGVDLGWQFALSNTITKSIPPQVSPLIVADVQDKLETYGKSLPMIGLLQVGFFL